MCLALPYVYVSKSKTKYICTCLSLARNFYNYSPNEITLNSEYDYTFCELTGHPNKSKR